MQCKLRILFLIPAISFLAVLEANATFDAGKSVVYIECKSADGKISQGSGVIVSKDGKVLTAKHVVPDGAKCLGAIGTGAVVPTRKLIRGRESSQFDARTLKFVRTGNETFTSAGYVKLAGDLKGKSIKAYGFPVNGTGELSQRSGTISTITPDAEGFIQTDALTARGMSGGPVILDSTGGLIGLVAGAEFDSATAAPTHFGVLAAQEIADELQIPEFDASKHAIFQRSGNAHVMISGSGGGDLASTRRAQADFGEFAQIAGRGGEKSDCDESSGRKVSEAEARARVGSHGRTGLSFDYRIHVQGGQFRTADSCGTGGPTGITEHDTQVNAEATLSGWIDFTISRQGKLTILWDKMPQNTVLKIYRHDEDTEDVVLKKPLTETGTKEIGGGRQLSLIPGRYRLTVDKIISVQSRSAGDPATREGTGWVKIDPDSINLSEPGGED